MEDFTMLTRREMTLTLAALATAFPVFRASAAVADAGAPNGRPGEFSSDEIIANGHRFFGSVSRGLAEIVEAATKRWGKPNGYVLGQEAGGAFIGGLRYGEGVMYTRNAGDLKVFWQGPSLGFDAGADGDRTMMLVYNLPATEAIFRRYGGVDGAAYL
ncbi:MAG: EipA family protein, partial [Methylocella sp.]